MGQKAIHEDLRAELAATVRSIGCELLEIELSGKALRVFIDRIDGAPEPSDSGEAASNGVTLDDCVAVSRQLSALLDAHDYGSDRYVLEVSSPGLDRKLYGPEDYQRFQGKVVRATFVEGPERQRKTLVGRLQGFSDEGHGAVTVIESSSDKSHAIPLSDIVVTRLEIEI